MASLCGKRKETGNDEGKSGILMWVKLSKLDENETRKWGKSGICMSKLLRFLVPKIWGKSFASVKTRGNEEKMGVFESKRGKKMAQIRSEEDKWGERGNG